MQTRVDAAGRFADAELAKAIPTLLTDLDQATMPAVRKAQIRSAIGVLQERAKHSARRIADQIRDKAVREAGVIAEQAHNLNDIVVVSSVDAGDDRAALMAATKHVRDTWSRAAVMLFSVDEEGGKVGVCAMVPDALIAKGLKAGDWLRDACAIIGGKGGGKPDSAQGGGTDVARVREAISAARKSAHKIVM
jgi:alanyl-tRNA synthetase